MCVCEKEGGSERAREREGEREREREKRERDRERKKEIERGLLEPLDRDLHLGSVALEKLSPLLLRLHVALILFEDGRKSVSMLEL